MLVEQGHSGDRGSDIEATAAYGDRGKVYDARPVSSGRDDHKTDVRRGVDGNDDLIVEITSKQCERVQLGNRLLLAVQPATAASALQDAQ